MGPESHERRNSRYFFDGDDLDALEAAARRAFGDHPKAAAFDSADHHAPRQLLDDDVVGPRRTFAPVRSRTDPADLRLRIMDHLLARA